MSYAKRRNEKNQRQALRREDKELANIQNLVKRGCKFAPRFHFQRNRAGRIVIRYTTGLFVKGRWGVDEAKEKTK